MERDFLGAIGRNKEEESEMKEDDTGGKAESGPCSLPLHSAAS